MIESCSKKKILLSISIFTLVSIILVIVETRLSKSSIIVGHNNSVNSQKISNETQNKNINSCSADREVIIKPCSRCSDFDLKFLNVCKISGYKMSVSCTNQKPAEVRSVSCPNAVGTRNFWIFESSMLTVFITSYGLVHYRQKHLNSLLLDKVHRQIASGV